MENKVIYRTALWKNINEMCSYLENELKTAFSDFEVSYEKGFIYKWDCDYIGFRYNANKQSVTFYIHHHPGYSLWIENGKLYDSINGECTYSFFNNFQWCKMDELEKAIERTQRNWGLVKLAVCDHKRKECNIFNFKV